MTMVDNADVDEFAVDSAEYRAKKRTDDPELAARIAARVNRTSVDRTRASQDRAAADAPRARSKDYARPAAVEHDAGVGRTAALQRMESLPEDQVVDAGAEADGGAGAGEQHKFVARDGDAAAMVRTSSLFKPSNEEGPQDTRPGSSGAVVLGVNGRAGAGGARDSKEHARSSVTFEVREPSPRASTSGESDSEESDGSDSDFSVDWVLTDANRKSFREHVMSALTAVVQHEDFELLILLLIVANCITLAMFKPLSGPEDSWNKNLETAELVFNSIFTLEMVLRILALGGPIAYMREPWNVFDFCMVAVGYTSFIPAAADGTSSLRALRALRALRPLRTITRFDSLRAVVACFIEAVPLLGQVVILIFFLLILFSIAGVSLFAEAYYRACYDPATDTYEPSPGNSPDELGCGGWRSCPAEYPVCANTGFNTGQEVAGWDNIGVAMLTCFQIITMGGWSYIMYRSVDNTGWWSAFFYILLVLFGAYYALNLFLAVLKVKYAKAQSVFQDQLRDKAEQETKKKNTLMRIGAHIRKSISEYTARRRAKSMARMRQSERINAIFLAHEAENEGADRRSSDSDEVDDEGNTSSAVPSMRPPPSGSLHRTVLEGRAAAGSPAAEGGSEGRRSLRIGSLKGGFGEGEENGGIQDDGNPFLSKKPALISPAATPGASQSGRSSKKAVNIAIPKTAAEIAEESERISDSGTDGLSSTNSGLISRGQEAMSAQMKLKLLEGMLLDARDQKAWFKVAMLHFRLWNFHIAEHRYFTNFFFFLILINTLLLAIEYDGMPQGLSDGLSMSNIVLTALFGLEVMIKIIGYGLPDFCADGFNIFDAFVVFMAILELSLLSGGGLSSLRALKSLRILKSFRVLRVFKMFRYLQSMRKVAEVVVAATGSFMSIALLILLVMLVFTIVGLHVYGPESLKRPEFDEEYQTTFSTFLRSLRTVFQLLTLEDWEIIMFSYVRTTGFSAVAYFLSWVVIGKWIFLTLFLAVTLEAFESKYDQQAVKEMKILAKKEKRRAARRDRARSKAESIKAGSQPGSASDGIFSFRPGRSPKVAPEISAADMPSDGTPMTPPRVAAAFAGHHGAVGHGSGLSSLRKSALKNPARPSRLANSSVVDSGNAPAAGARHAHSGMEIGDDVARLGTRASGLRRTTAPGLPAAAVMSLAEGSMQTNDTSKFSHFDIDHVPESPEEHQEAGDAQINNAASGQDNSVGAGTAEFAPAVSAPPAEEGRAEEGSPGSGDTRQGSRGDAGGVPPTEELLGPQGFGEGWFSGKKKGSDDAVSSESESLYSTRSGTSFALNSETREVMELQREAAELYGEAMDDASASQHSGGKQVTKPKAKEGMRLVGKTFWIIGRKNPIRKFIFHKVVTKSWFDYSMFLVILVNCAFMMLERPTIVEGHSLYKMLKYADICFAVIFAAEAILKIIALNFKQYWKSHSNKLDLMIAAVSLIEVSLQSSSIRGLKAFRVLRAFKPLRALTRSAGMQLVFRSITLSMASMANVSVILMLFVMVFGILGVQLFNGRFKRCNDTSVAGVDECVGTFTNPETGEEEERVWSNTLLNFDHLGNAMLCLFVVSTLDGYAQILDDAMAAGEKGEQPQPGQNVIALIYFILFVFLVGFCLLNMYVGVVFYQFSRIRLMSTAGCAFMTQEQTEWIELNKMIARLSPQEKPPLTKSKFRKFCRKVVDHDAFEWSIMTLIVLSTLSMAVEHYNQPDEMTSILEYINYFFTGVFVLEALFKIGALGFMFYIRNPWNRFDFIIVCTTLFDTFFSFLGLSFVRTMRVLRLTRMLRLIRRVRGLNEMFYTLYLSLPAFGNVGAFLLLLFFMYAYVGVLLFGESPRTPSINEHANFSDFGRAMITLFRASTNDEWVSIMSDLAEPGKCAPTVDGGTDCGSFVAIPYLVSFVLLVSMIMINLFTTVIIENFEKQTKQDEWTLHPDSLDRFIDLWAQKDLGDGTIEPRDLEEILVKLGPPLGIPKDANARQVIAFVLELDIPLDQNGHVPFKRALYELVKKVSFIDIPEGQVKSQIDRLFKKFFHSQETEEHMNFSAYVTVLRVQRRWRLMLRARKLRQRLERRQQRMAPRAPPLKQAFDLRQALEAELKKAPLPDGMVLAVDPYAMEDFSAWFQAATGVEVDAGTGSPRPSKKASRQAKRQASRFGRGLRTIPSVETDGLGRTSSNGAGEPRLSPTGSGRLKNITSFGGARNRTRFSTDKKPDRIDEDTPQ
ncbi:unnamed protein product [Pedinophyceae sp. YPF-701]|nr:unnamed protein product [Pedinophyceae sp. YPF-701]